MSFSRIVVLVIDIFVACLFFLIYVAEYKFLFTDTMFFVWSEWEIGNPDFFGFENHGRRMILLIPIFFLNCLMFAGGHATLSDTQKGPEDSLIITMILSMLGVLVPIPLFLYFFCMYMVNYLW